MKPDALINGVSMLSLGWLRETVNFPTPQSQSNTITVPGRNSPIRFTEALGRVAYQPRSFDMTFSMLGDRADYDRLVNTVVNRFAGQLCRVTLTEDPTLYAIGTLGSERLKPIQPMIRLQARVNLCCPARMVTPFSTMFRRRSRVSLAAAQSFFIMTICQ